MLYDVTRYLYIQHSTFRYLFSLMLWLRLNNEFCRTICCPNNYKNALKIETLDRRIKYIFMVTHTGQLQLQTVSLYSAKMFVFIIES